MRPKKIPVSGEGVPFIGFSAFTTLVFALIGWMVPAVIALAVTAFVLYFFRDPGRVVPHAPGLVVSPADGRVIEVADSAEGSLQGDSVKRISIFMNIFNVHVNRAPLAGEVVDRVYRPGTFFPADKKKALLRNEQNALLIKGDDGFQVTVVQVAGIIARRIVCWAEVGDKLKRGERFGLIRFGSRLDVYVPPHVTIVVKKGERVWAGQSVLASQATDSHN